MDETEQKQAIATSWRTLVGFALITVLILGMAFVMHQLRHATALQDCVASGRRDCAPIEGGRG